MFFVLEFVVEFDGLSVLPGLDLSDDLISTAGINSGEFLVIILSHRHMRKIDTLIGKRLAIHEL